MSKGFNREYYDSLEQKQQQLNIGRWEPYEHLRFMVGISIFGRDWRLIHPIVQTRDLSALRSHCQKFIKPKFFPVVFRASFLRKN